MRHRMQQQPHPSQLLSLRETGMTVNYGPTAMVPTVVRPAVIEEFPR
jgi:hypothetical protein